MSGFKVALFVEGSTVPLPKLLRERRPDENILAPAIRAVSRVRPKLLACRVVGGDLKTKKNEWGEYLLRRMLRDARIRPSLLEHPLPKRLAELLQPCD